MRRGLILVLLVTLAALLAVPVGAATPFGMVTELTPESGDSPSSFGWSVAMSGDGSTVVVGDSTAGSYDFGSAFEGLALVFERSSTGTWTRSTAIDASFTHIRYGISVAISDDGSTIVVGDSGDDGATHSGLLAVAERPSGGWSSSPVTTADAVLEPDPSDSPHSAGVSVAISGDGSTIVAGDTDFGANVQSPENQGVFIFERPTSGWADGQSDATLSAPASATTPSRFGDAVAIADDGGTIVVGDPSGVDSRSFVYTEPTSGWADTSTPDAELDVGFSADKAALGDSVAMTNDGGTIVVGDPTAGSSPYPGAVHVYDKPGSGGWSGTLTPTVTLTASPFEDPGDFGESVSVSDDGATVVVGDPDAGGSDSGRVFVLEMPESGWDQGPVSVFVLASSSLSNAHEFGWSVSLSDDGTRLISGDRNGGSTFTGNAVIFEPSFDAVASVDIQSVLAIQATDVEFPAANIGLSGVTVVFDAASNPWQMRGDDSTWSLTLEVAGDLTSGSGGTIPVNVSDGGLMTVQIESEDIVPGTGAGLSPITAVSSPTALSVGSALTVLDADGTGSTGLFEIGPTFTLAIPGTTPDGSYSTTLIATTVSGP